MIDLGKAEKVYGLPMEPEDVPAKTKIVYPRLYVSGSPGMLKITDSGESTIEYKVLRREVSKSSRDGKKESAHVEIELEIISFEPSEKPKKEKSTEDALDDLLEEVTS